jgi:hypothetical protein
VRAAMRPLQCREWLEGGNALDDCGIGSVHLFSKWTPLRCPRERLPRNPKLIQTATTVRLPREQECARSIAPGSTPPLRELAGVEC